jgi:hypothetical protein
METYSFRKNRLHGNIQFQEEMEKRKVIRTRVIDTAQAVIKNMSPPLAETPDVERVTSPGSGEPEDGKEQQAQEGITCMDV